MLFRSYYLSALQIDNGGHYVLTPISNGEPTVTLDFILQVYPQLTNHIDKIIYKPYDENEKLIKTDKIILTEAEVGPPQEFAYATHDQQLDYILSNNIITKAKN